MYSDLSRKIADKFLTLNTPHGVPPWDFSVPDALNAPRDSSAGAIVACGLMELDQLGDTRARSEAATLIIEMSQRVVSFDDEQDGILLDSTSSLPNDTHISDSLIYGDYYYYEALQRLTGVHKTCW